MASTSTKKQKVIKKPVAPKKAKPQGLIDLIHKINKEIGDGTIIDSTHAVKVDVIPTGIPSLDVALGIGGLPRGRIIEIFGVESSGKTTTTLQVIAACQQRYFESKQRNGVAGFIDVEHALDPTWAKANGVDMKSMLLSQPDSGEEALQVCKLLAESGEVDIIIVDSVAALIPRSELEGEIGDNQIGAQARLMSKSCRVLKGVANKTGTSIVFINQIRYKIGVMYGSPETTPGGNALKFYASVRIDMRKGSALKLGGENGTDVGIRTRCKVIKNKIAPPFRRAEYDIYFGKSPDGKMPPIYGVDYVGSLLEAAIELKVVTLTGSWYNFRGQKLGNGASTTTALLYKHAELAQFVSEDVNAAMQHGGVEIDAEDGEPPDEVTSDAETPDGDDKT